MTIEEGARFIQSIREQVQKAIVGQDHVVHQVISALVAGGHVLVEGMPGLGKTYLVRALAKAIGGKSHRVQFTPDLMPSDIIGTVVYDLPTGKFTTRKGPVFTNLLLADEINRAPAKTQAALLEVMQEYQVTFDGTTHALERPFMTLATQNPLEHEGTYPLPDAQLDRFLLKVIMPYPELADEVAFVDQVLRGKTGDDLDLAAVGVAGTVAELAQVQVLASTVRVDVQLVDYAVRLVAATRNHEGLRIGAGPRASLALIRLARAGALADGRDFVTPDDLRSWAVPVLGHRVVPSPEWEMDGRGVSEVLAAVLAEVKAPRE